VINLLLNARDTVVDRSARMESGADWTPSIHIEAGAGEPEREHATALESGSSAGWVRLRVTDNGMGMDEAVRERVFEPFFTTKPTGRGTGLGLATVWHLVRAEGGQIIIDSRLAEGTTMNVYLPATVATAIPDEVNITPMTFQDAKAGGLRVLLVEDQELVGSSVEGLLIHYGHEVRWISDGVEAWTWIQRNLNAFDVLISDLNLPGLSGLELVERVSTAGFKGKIIAYSGMISADMESRLRGIGIHGLLAKPFQIQQLIELLRE
jgi:two-component system, cell cycle sensor histidine kinase and response regulator CckA